MTDSPLENSQALPAGTRIEEFLIERVLGAGGFGITYLARDTALGRQVVIKENLPASFCFRDTHSLTVAPRHTTGEDADYFKWSLENFSGEAAMLASLDHPGIVRVHRSFRAFGTACFVMPFVEGETLDKLMKQRGDKPFAEAEVQGMLKHVLNALAYLHDRGIYHRDIKPGNILITNEGIPVLIDFGSARQKLSERSMTVIESAGYTPFEQLQSRGNVGPWSDLYALGATLAKVITGETLPKAADRILNDPWQGLNHDPWMWKYSSRLLSSIDRATEARSEARWQSAEQWKEYLKRAEEEIGSEHHNTRGGYTGKPNRADEPFAPRATDAVAVSVGKSKPSAMVHISSHDGTVSQHTEDEVQAMLSRGTIREDRLAWKEGMQDWQAVGEWIGPEFQAKVSYAKPRAIPNLKDNKSAHDPQIIQSSDELFGKKNPESTEVIFSKYRILKLRGLLFHNDGKGRIGIKAYWQSLTAIFFTVILALIMCVISGFLYKEFEVSILLVLFLVISIPSGILYIILCFSLMHLIIKRVHDIDGSAVWGGVMILLFCLLPIPLAILGCIKGSPGVNQHGPPPPA